jgi:hypothetical protein
VQQTLAAHEGRKAAFAAIEGLHTGLLPKPIHEAQRLISGIARLLRDFQESAQAAKLSVSAPMM